MELLSRLLAFGFITLFAHSAAASHHSWRMSEVFSNADGSLQFVEMQSSADGHDKIICCQLVAGDASTGVDTGYRFPQNLPSSSTAGKSMLIATAAFESTFGIRPDYIIPDGFLTTGAGDVFYNDAINWNSLPTDGVTSLGRVNGELIKAPATPKNFSDIETLLEATADATPPIITNLPAEPVEIASNTSVSSDDSRITDALGRVTCIDDVDDAPTLTIDLPERFNIDTTSDLVFICSDEQGNTASAELQISVISFSDNDGDELSDDSDTDDDNDGVPDTEDAFPFDDSESLDSDGDGIGNNADPDDNGNGIPDVDEQAGKDTDGDGLTDNLDTDDDNDGLPDDFETDNGLDPLDASDAQADRDQDGLSNLSEFQMGKDISADDVPPVITLNSPIEIAATGRLTYVEHDVSATDAKDGQVGASTSETGPYPTGRNVVLWEAFDEAGNQATEVQIINVLPLVAIQSDQIVAEGDQVRVDVALNGTAPAYPVTIEYVISGDLTLEDFNPPSGNLVIPSGTSAAIIFNTSFDGVPEPDEVLTLTIANLDGAVPGANTQHSITITEDNLAPTVLIQVQQGDEQRSTVAQTGEMVKVTAVASDPNLEDELSFDWSGSSEALEFTSTSNSQILSPDIETGLYIAQVTVSDNAGNQASTTRSQTLRVVSDFEPLSASLDSDGDGVSDAAEGFNDQDYDGIPDYLDSTRDTTILGTTGNLVIETTPGLRLKTGEISQSGFASSALVELSDLEAWAASKAGSASTDDTVFEYVDEFFDFEIDRLRNSGQSAKLIITLSNPIPADAAYRKYSTTNGWQTFSENSGNEIASVISDASTCPPPGSTDYQSGLIEGASCLQLTLLDGGANDADGLANGSIRDPGAIAVRDSTPPDLSVPANLSITSDTNVTADNEQVRNFLSTASCSDNLSGDLTVTNDAPDEYNVGSNTTVTFACIDDAGNDVSASATISLSEPAPEPAALTPTGSSGGSGCFIATAAYGSALAPELELLRSFRDNQLLKHSAGAWFVERYYEHSPPIAAVIDTSPLLAKLTRIALFPVVYGIKYPMLALGCLMLILIVLQYRARRDRI